MNILLSEHAGFCFGVRRAVELLESRLSEGKKIYTLGHIIHNEDFNADLERRGVVCVSPEELDRVEKDALVLIRTHGVTRDTVKRLEEHGLDYLDATCPFVKKIHNIVLEEERKALLSGEKIAFVLLGDPTHPEVQGIVSCAEHFPVAVINSCEELISYEKTADREARHIFLSQTTHSVSEWERCCERAREVFSRLSFFDTICSVTGIRQKEARSIAEKSDLVESWAAKKAVTPKSWFRCAKRFAKPFISEMRRNCRERSLERI